MNDFISLKNKLQTAIEALGIIADPQHELSMDVIKLIALNTLKIIRIEENTGGNPPEDLL